VVFLLKTPKHASNGEWRQLETDQDEAFENKVNLMLMNGRSDVQAIKYIRKEKNLGLLHAKQYLDRTKESKK
jgi:ribosomal protein L7/L12